MGTLGPQYLTYCIGTWTLWVIQTATKGPRGGRQRSLFGRLAWERKMLFKLPWLWRLLPGNISKPSPCGIAEEMARSASAKRSACQAEHSADGGKAKELPLGPLVWSLTMFIEI